MIKRKLPSTNFVFHHKLELLKKKEKSDVVVGHNLVSF